MFEPPSSPWFVSRLERLRWLPVSSASSGDFRLMFVTSVSQCVMRQKKLYCCLNVNSGVFYSSSLQGSPKHKPLPNYTHKSYNTISKPANKIRFFCVNLKCHSCTTMLPVPLYVVCVTQFVTSITLRYPQRCVTGHKCN